ncbi:MAG: S8 family serine peptidase, partial [Frankia sp.]|nr:S8 family serine peptidase [Frankia sp.]
MVAAGMAALPGTALAKPAPPPDRDREQRAVPSLWYAESLRLTQAHGLSTGEGVTVAVIDGGVDASHPALAGRVIPGAGFGEDAAPDGMRDSDSTGHGTGMASLIAGRASGPDGRSTGIIGVAPDAKILPISLGAELDTTEVAQAIRLATDLGAQVINLSLGSAGAPSPLERSAVTYAMDHDVIVVAAAGNRDAGDETIIAPANIPGVIAVTGYQSDGEFWSGSATGAQAVLAAPAAGIRVALPSDLSYRGFAAGDGTSNATAIVSGVVALVRALHPDLGAPAVIDLLLRTA